MTEITQEVMQMDKKMCEEEEEEVMAARFEGSWIDDDGKFHRLYTGVDWKCEPEE